MKSVVVRFTLLAIVITVAWTVSEHFLGYNTTNHERGAITRMISAFLFYACIVWAIVVRRRRQNNVLSFGQGFRTGAAISAAYGVLVTLWFALYAEVINPQYQSTLLTYERSKLVAAHASPDEIAAKLAEVEMSSGGSVISYLLLFLFMTLFGMVITVIASLLLKRKAK